MTELTHVGIPPYLQKRKWWKLSDWRREKLLWRIFYDWTHYPSMTSVFCYGVSLLQWIMVCTKIRLLNQDSFYSLNRYAGYYTLTGKK